MNMDKVKHKIQQALEENPLTVVAVASGAALAVAKLITAVTEAKNSRTWKKEVDRRDRVSKRR
jgi:hypothetical protein